MDYINAHRKAIIAAIGALLVIFVDDATAQTIAAALDAVLVLAVPNDQAAVERVYRKRT
jgi:hypothetical protein